MSPPLCFISSEEQHTTRASTSREQEVSDNLIVDSVHCLRVRLNLEAGEISDRSLCTNHPRASLRDRTCSSEHREQAKRKQWFCDCPYTTVRYGNDYITNMSATTKDTSATFFHDFNVQVACEFPSFTSSPSPPSLYLS